MFDLIRTWWIASGDLARLQGMDDRMLDDMGVSREDLHDRVLGRTFDQDGGIPSRTRLGLPKLIPR